MHSMHSHNAPMKYSANNSPRIFLCCCTAFGSTKKAFTLLMMWVPTMGARPNALFSTIWMFRGGTYNCSLGSSCRHQRIGPSVMSLSSPSPHTHMPHTTSKVTTGSGKLGLLETFWMCLVWTTVPPHSSST